MFQINDGVGCRFDGAAEGGSVLENLPVQIGYEVDSKRCDLPEEACDWCAHQNNLIVFMRM